LRVFNYLNFGSNKAEAPGFSLDTIRTIENVKSAKKYSLLSLVVKCVYYSDPKKFSFLDTYEDLPKLLKYNLAEFEKQKSEFGKNIAAIDNELHNVDKLMKTYATKPEKQFEMECFQVFKDHFTPFVEKAKNQLDDLETELQHIKTASSKCAEFYGLTPNFPPDQLLKLVMEFQDSVRRNLSTIQKAEQAAKKKAEYEAKMKALQGVKPVPSIKPAQPRPSKLKPQPSDTNTDSDSVSSPLEVAEVKPHPRPIDPDRLKNIQIVKPVGATNVPPSGPQRKEVTRARTKIDSKYKPKDMTKQQQPTELSPEKSSPQNHITAQQIRASTMRRAEGSVFVQETVAKSMII
jgi:hypothetical protein